MQQVTELTLDRSDTGVFTRAELACWAGGSPDRQFGLLRRALRSGEVLRIHRGLYCLAPRLLPRKVDPLVLAQRIYGPSYISLETALSHHGWIPEAAYTITSVSRGRSREFDSPVARFSYTRVPQRVLYAGVDRVETDDGESCLLASPLKALADYVYVHRRDWASAEPLIESLRVDQELLAGLDPEAMARLRDNYASLRVRRFLEGLRRDLTR